MPSIVGLCPVEDEWREILNPRHIFSDTKRKHVFAYKRSSSIAASQLLIVLGDRE
jgi:hypothetical protein